ncbi:MAG: hypothetical protein LYZ66_04625 [Nitrososphaerales archaeon]|nr:hypothetical protein [Nitrososphaerales archaeon]
MIIQLPFFSLLKKRRFWAAFREPRLNVAYRVVGFVAMLVFSAGSVAASLDPSRVPLPLALLSVAATFSAVVFLVGLASSEVWESTTRRLQYVVSASPHDGERLVLFVGVLATVIVALVALLFRL